MRTTILAAVLLVIGCDGGEPTERQPDALTGTEWSADMPPNCALGLTFSEGGLFESIRLCLIPDVSYVGMQRERGTYAISGGRIHMRNIDVTCSSTPMFDSPGFTIDGKLMRVDGAAYTRVTPGQGTGTASQVAPGCLDAMGAFTASP